MWIEQIQLLEPAATFLPAATDEQIATLEAFLGVALPDDLKNLLFESNGVQGRKGNSLIWSTEESLQRNQEMRTPEMRANYLSFEHLLFFADAGNGDQFAYGIIQGEVKFQKIYAWKHEDDSRICFASSLEAFLTGWLSGKRSI
jgi:hypothetical protein